MWAVSASAQAFDLSSNNGRFELGFNAGKIGTSTPYARFGNGINVMAYGVYVDFNIANPQHRYDNHYSDTKWEDDEVLMFNAGYQIPVTSWLRVMPLVGYVQTNEGLTDASTINVTDDTSRTFYHSYKVTPGTREHYFNCGGGISVQPLKWFSLNFIYTRYGIYGGFGINLAAF